MLNEATFINLLYILKLIPHPQDEEALGLSTVKRAPINSSV